MRCIDLNCDLGESFGAWRMGQDEAVFDFISSANIACGFHAGDPLIMQRTLTAAKRRSVAVGAHPSLPDLQGFGRRAMQVSAAEVYALTLYQIGALSAFARAADVALAHVKPHGALYHMTNADPQLADALAAAVRDFDARLILVGFAGGALTQAGARLGLQVAQEAFVDRRYQRDGSLRPRAQPDAVIDVIDEAVHQALSIVLEGKVVSCDGNEAVAVSADTLCLHGDRPDAAAFAAALRLGLQKAGVRIAAISRESV